MNHSLSEWLSVYKNAREKVLSRAFGTPDAIRTHDLQSRSLTLYPAELRAHLVDASSNITDLTTDFKCKSDFWESFFAVKNFRVSCFKKEI